MKCFERLVMEHIRSVLAPTIDPFQFAYRAKRSSEDAICSALHSALTHLERRDSYVRLLFVDFSSAFNTIVPKRLISKLDKLGLSTYLCNWLLDFLCQRPQVLRVGDKISASITLSTGAPQGCVLSPLLFTLLTHDCTATYSDNRIVKFADDTTLVGLITEGDETQYRLEVDLLTTWCRDNNLLLNVDKTKEIVVDFRKGHTQHLPLTIDGAVVERVSSARFLGVHISEDLSWSTNTASLAKKAQRRLYFLRKLRRASARPAVMTTFYRGTIESVLSSCIAVWGGSCTDYNLKALQCIVNTAGDRSGKRYRSLRSRTTRLTNSFILQARSLFLRSVLYFCAMLTVCCMHTGSVLLLLFIVLFVYLLFIHHSYYLLFVPSCFYIVSFTCMSIEYYVSSPWDRGNVPYFPPYKAHLKT
ncbi:protein ABHD18 isoform 1-T3 [Syngnathus typhle]